MSARKYVWRLVVDFWPTENGKPFAEQGFDYWARIVNALKGGEPVPDWMPKDLDRWLPDSGYLGERHGYLICDGDDGDWETGYPGWRQDMLYVPYVSSKRYLTRGRLPARLEELRAWGCDAHIERAEMGEWEKAA
ncbi:hypothetical protein [Nocardia sp. NPDC049707]|uniref:hypothetical protein n=1 Tax=Nocardia sp. NPDC049707 TaxID=3154735 RepID=UPI0034247E83